MAEPLPPVLVDPAAGADDTSTPPLALALAAITDRPFRWRPSSSDAPGDGLRADLLALFEASKDGDVVSVRPLRSPVVELASHRPAAELLASIGFALGFVPARTLLRVHAPTHPVDGPGFHDLALGLAPRLAVAGLAFEPFLVAAGLGASEGTAELAVPPVAGLRGFDLAVRGVLRDARVVGLVANLGVGIALQLREAAARCLKPLGLSPEVEILPLPGAGSRGIAMGVVLEFEGGRYTNFVAGEPGASAEALAARLSGRVARVLASRALLDAAAVNALLPFAGIAAGPLGGRGRVGAWSPSPSRFAVDRVTVDLLQRAELVRRFLDVDVRVAGLPGGEGRVDVVPV